MNVMHMKGELTPDQAKFMAASKPEFELFDLKNDPHELQNLSDDPAHQEVKAELLSALNEWRENVIQDQGVADDFRAANKFPESLRGGLSVDDWVVKNFDNHDFYTNGWPAWYPTRSLEQWEAAMAKWEPYVFRKPAEKVQRPKISHDHRRRK
jgi:uncharacterized sulfatase